MRWRWWWNKKNIEKNLRHLQVDDKNLSNRKTVSARFTPAWVENRSTSMLLNAYGRSLLIWRCWLRHSVNYKGMPLSSSKEIWFPNSYSSRIGWISLWNCTIRFHISNHKNKLGFVRSTSKLCGTYEQTNLYSNRATNNF